MEEEKVINLELKESEVKIVMQHLVKGTYSTVNKIIFSINKQYKNQLEKSKEV